MPNYVQLEDILPSAKGMREIKTGSELYFLCALNKELIRACGAELDVSEFMIDKHVVLYSAHWNYVSSQGMNFKEKFFQVNVLSRKVVQEERRRNIAQFYAGTVDNLPYDIDTTTQYNVDEEQRLIFSRSRYIQDPRVHELSTFIVANCTGTPYIMMWAHFLVKNYLTRLNNPNAAVLKLHIANENIPAATGEYHDLYILRYEGNCLLRDDGILTFEHHINAQPDILAYKTAWQQKGFMLECSSAKQKHALTQRKYVPGDVLLLYETKDPSRMSSKENNTGGFVMCSIVIIREIHPDYLMIDKLASPNNRLTAHKEWLCNKTINAALYSSVENQMNTPVRERLAWSKLGINACYYNEGYMFVDARQEDSHVVWVFDGVVEHQVEMPTCDVIYECLKDWDIPFAEERFISKYFEPGYLPLHTLFANMRAQAKNISEAAKDAWKRKCEAYVNADGTQTVLTRDFLQSFINGGIKEEKPAKAVNNKNKKTAPLTEDTSTAASASIAKAETGVEPEAPVSLATPAENVTPVISDVNGAASDSVAAENVETGAIVENMVETVENSGEVTSENVENPVETVEKPKRTRKKAEKGITEAAVKKAKSATKTAAASSKKSTTKTAAASSKKSTTKAYDKKKSTVSSKKAAASKTSSSKTATAAKASNTKASTTKASTRKKPSTVKTAADKVKNAKEAVDNSKAATTKASSGKRAAEKGTTTKKSSTTKTAAAAGKTKKAVTGAKAGKSVSEKADASVKNKETKAAK